MFRVWSVCSGLHFFLNLTLYCTTSYLWKWTLISPITSPWWNQISDHIRTHWQSGTNEETILLRHNTNDCDHMQCSLLSPLNSFLSLCIFSIAMATKENMTSQRGMLKSIQSRVNTLASILYAADVHGCVCVWVWKPTVGYEIPAVPSDINAHICFLYNGKWLFVVKIHGDVPSNRWVIIWFSRVQIMQECLNKELQQFVILVMKKTLSDKCFTYPHYWFMLALCFIMSMLSL